MKNMRIFFLSLALVSLAIANTSCGSNAASDGADMAYTADYVCPMHCVGSGSSEAGTCPECGMDYVARAEHESNGHTHDAMEQKGDDHDGHDHDGHDHDHDHDHDHEDHVH